MLFGDGFNGVSDSGQVVLNFDKQGMLGRVKGNRLFF
jgi:hypothetical protein